MGSSDMRSLLQAESCPTSPNASHATVVFRAVDGVGKREQGFQVAQPVVGRGAPSFPYIALVHQAPSFAPSAGLLFGHQAFHPPYYIRRGLDWYQADGNLSGGPDLDRHQ